MPLSAWSNDVRLGEKTETGLLVERLYKGKIFTPPENGYFVNDPWMEESDLTVITLEESEAAHQAQVDTNPGRRIFWFLIGALAGGAAFTAIQ